MFLGMDILSDEQSLSNSKLVSNLSSFSMKNGVFDELYVSSDPNKFKKKEYDWAADTLILATFDSQTLEGGNIGALGSKIQSMQLRRREVGDVTWTTLAAYQVPDKQYVTLQTTYNNALRRWIEREPDVSVVQSIKYGAQLPDDLQKEIVSILMAANAEIQTIVKKLSTAIANNEVEL